VLTATAVVTSTMSAFVTRRDRDPAIGGPPVVLR
jgi:hypothetical protein